MTNKFRIATFINLENLVEIVATVREALAPFSNTVFVPRGHEKHVPTGLQGLKGGWSDLVQCINAIGIGQSTIIDNRYYNLAPIGHGANRSTPSVKLACS